MISRGKQLLQHRINCVNGPAALERTADEYSRPVVRLPVIFSVIGQLIKRIVTPYFTTTTLPGKYSAFRALRKGATCSRVPLSTVSKVLPERKSRPYRNWEKEPG